MPPEVQVSRWPPSPLLLLAVPLGLVGLLPHPPRWLLYLLLLLWIHPLLSLLLVLSLLCLLVYLTIRLLR
jgi:hypothetical protein